jgi:hypothetical protein
MSILKKSWAYIGNSSLWQKFGKGLWFALFRVPPKRLAGKLLVSILPNSYINKVKGKIWADKNFFEDLIISAIAGQYHSLENNKRTQLNKKEFWGAIAGDSWHDERETFYSKSPEIAFAGRQWFIDKIKDELKMSTEIATLIEIGTGNGVFLDYLSRQLPEVKKFVGLDLNSNTITKAKGQFKNNQSLEFYDEDLFDYLLSSGSKGFILVVCDTLSYFPMEDLEAFFKSIRNPDFGKVVVATYEYVDMDINSEFDSIPKGNIGLSHNHPYLAKKVGLYVRDFYVKNLDPSAPRQNSISMIARNF